MEDTTKDLNLSVIKAFTLLDAFSGEQQKWGVRELAKKVGYNTTTTFRLLRTLESLSVVQKDSDDKYILGLKLFELGNLVPIYKSLRYFSRIPLENIAKEIKETIHFGVLKDHKVLLLNKAESPQGLKVSTQIGSYQDAYCSALGKVLLAYLSETEQNSYFENNKLIKHTDNTIVDKQHLKKELDTIKKQAYALDMEELELGLICIAIPVFNQHKEVVAAISAAGPSSRFKEENINSYLEILLRGASQLEKKLVDFN